MQNEKGKLSSTGIMVLFSALCLLHSSFGNPCCRNASNKTSATQFDKFNERDLALNIGIRNQRSRLSSSNGFGKPAVSRPKTR